jgi:hypothetical protein
LIAEEKEGNKMKYQCDVCGKIVESDDDLHEDPCPDHCGGLLYDALMLAQERSYGGK